MTGTHRPPRPKALLDAIEAEVPVALSGPVWRVVAAGRDPLCAARSGGRWDDGTFDVLYTSKEREGAIAEAWFHATKGQPVIPSKVSRGLYRLQVNLERVLDLSGGGKLARLGVAMATFGRMSYVQRVQEYPTPQQIAEIAFFHEYQALIVPNARWPTHNVVVLTEHVRPGQVVVAEAEGEPVDLAAWGASARMDRR